MQEDRWAKLDSFDLSEVIPSGYTQAQISREDISSVCREVRGWYPDIEVGIGSKFLSERYYDENISLAGEPERDTIAYIGKYDGEIVSLLILTRNRLSRAVFGEFGAVAPKHRRGGVSMFGGFMLEAQARAMGYAMSYTLVTLKTIAMQRMLERGGFSPVGIVPASDRERLANGDVLSVSEVLYAKVFLERSAMLTVSTENMTAAVAKLWEAVNPDCLPSPF